MMTTLEGRRVVKGVPQYDVPFDEYMAWPQLNQTTAKIGFESMAHLQAAIEDPDSKKVTDDMLLGSALHCALLEPELMPERVVVYTGRRDDRIKDWQNYKEEHKGKIILPAGKYAALKKMLRACRRSKYVRHWMGRPGDVEVSIIGEINGVEMKTRTDKLTDEPLVDLKKTRSTRRWLFEKQIRDFGYDIQAYVNTQLFGRDDWVALAVEESGCDVSEFWISRELIADAGRRFNKLLDDYKRCQDTGIWPGRNEEPITVGMTAEGGGIQYGDAIINTSGADQ